LRFNEIYKKTLLGRAGFYPVFFRYFFRQGWKIKLGAMRKTNP